MKVPGVSNDTYPIKIVFDQNKALLVTVISKTLKDDEQISLINKFIMKFIMELKILKTFGLHLCETFAQRNQ